jgi:UDP-glucose 4-epimerase
MKILVTGGAGFIGSHLIETLINEGHEVIAVDDLSTGNQDNLVNVWQDPRFSFCEGSILDVALVKALLGEVDGCFHLGAALGVNRILESPLQSLETNLKGTENILSCSAQSGIKVFLASTSEIYGKNPIQPLSEESDRVLGSPKLLRWAYSEAKAIDETLAEIFKKMNGLKYVVGRFFNTVGPRQTGAYGMVLPRFVNYAIKGENLRVYGDGNQTRVFCHVQDAVSAMISLFHNEKSEGEAFNIGGEEEVSIRELAERVISVTGSTSRLEYVSYEDAYPVGFEETMRRVPNTTKLRMLTGWKPQFTLNETIKTVEDFFRSKS